MDSINVRVAKRLLEKRHTLTLNRYLTGKCADNTVCYCTAELSERITDCNNIVAYCKI